jgi:hypothetical protein
MHLPSQRPPRQTLTLRSPVWRPRPILVRLTIDPLEHALQSLGRAMETPACCDVFDLDDTASPLAHSVNRMHAEAVSQMSQDTIN